MSLRMVCRRGCLLALALALVAVALPPRAEEDTFDLAARQADHPLPAPLVRLSAARLKSLRAALAELDRDGGASASKDRAVLLYHIGLESRSYRADGEALDQLRALAAKQPHDAEILVYLGSAYTLRARDFPLQGAWQVLPGPGYVRLYDTGKGIGIIDAAMAADPQNPVVRLIRGISFTKMPRPFGRFGDGLADLERLQQRIERPGTDPTWRGIVEDPGFRGDVLLGLAEAYWLDGRLPLSREIYARAAAAAPAGSPAAQAAREMVVWTPR